MKRISRATRAAATGLLVLTASAAISGCHFGAAPFLYVPPVPPHMLGTQTDGIMEQQEVNAEASKYVIYVHEFKLPEQHEGRVVSPLRLNTYGEDHVKRIAASLRAGANFPVVVERSQTSVDPNTTYKYPVHFNPDLDLKRREVVVAALTEMGIADAEQRVVVAPAFAQPHTGVEAERAYYRGLNNFGGNGMGGMGGFGFGGMGGFGF